MLLIVLPSNVQTIKWSFPTDANWDSTFGCQIKWDTFMLIPIEAIGVSGPST